MILIAREYKMWNEGNMHIKKIGIIIRLENRGAVRLSLPRTFSAGNKIVNLLLPEEEPGKLSYVVTALQLFFTLSTSTIKSLGPR
jgi:hypothetical protein